jgi:hypothetical protein
MTGYCGRWGCRHQNRQWIRQVFSKVFDGYVSITRGLHAPLKAELPFCRSAVQFELVQSYGLH